MDKDDSNIYRVLRRCDELRRKTRTVNFEINPTPFWNSGYHDGVVFHSFSRDDSRYAYCSRDRYDPAKDATKGDGAIILSKICEICDEEGVTMSLFTYSEALVLYYERFGFVPYPGHLQRYYGTPVDMYRLPVPVDMHEGIAHGRYMVMPEMRA